MLLHSDSPSSLVEAENILLTGGIIAFPTETVYGIGVVAGDVTAEQRLREIKGREGNKPFQILVADVRQAKQYAKVSADAEKIMETFWPGPLTLVLPAIGGGTVGLRAPDCQWILALLKKIKKGIIATSANFADFPAAVNVDEVMSGIGGKVDLVIDGGACASGIASTVASFCKERVDVLREGAVSAAAMERAIR